MLLSENAGHPHADCRLLQTWGPTKNALLCKKETAEATPKSLFQHAILRLTPKWHPF